MNAFVNVTTIAKSERKSNEQKRPIIMNLFLMLKRERKKNERAGSLSITSESNMNA